MKVNLNGTGVLATAAILSGLAAAAYLLVMFGPKLKRLATKTLNPASSENIVNQGVHAVVSDAVGYDESLGGFVADKVFKWRHPNFQLSGPTHDHINPTVAPRDLSRVDSAGFGPAPYERSQRLSGVHSELGPAPYAKTYDGDYIERAPL